MVLTHRQLDKDANEVNSLEEFKERYADKYEFEDEDEDSLTVCVDGDRYLIEVDSYGCLEVSNQVTVINDRMRCDEVVTLEYSDLYFD